jgi:hypothetical protein
VSKGRRALIRKLLDQRKQRKVVWVGLKLPERAYDSPLLATLSPGEIRKIPGSPTRTPSWIGRSECGTQFYQTLGPVVQKAVRGQRVAINDADVVAHVREMLAQKVEAAKSAPPAPAVQSAVQNAKQPAAIGTRLARCPGCGTKNEVPAGGEAGTCRICSRGDL